MTDSVRLWHRGEIVEVTDVPADSTVLAWLRTTRRSMGTREGCNEGDCGACAIALGIPDGRDGLSVSVRHACTMLVPMLHGTALITVEDLARDGELQPMQRAMVDNRGSQCGFCTPGIVVSLWRLHHDAWASGRTLEPEEVRTGLSGHICRCTGYRSIVEAGVAASAFPEALLDEGVIVHALGAIARDRDLDYAAQETTYLAPATTDALLRGRRDRPDARLVAGGTDVLPDVPGRGELPAHWLATSRVRGFDEVRRVNDALVFGGGASIEAAWSALAAEFPTLERGWRRFASPPIREAGTLAGNLVTGSPVGDSAPLLLALDARIVLANVDSERTVPLDDFYSGYRQTVMAPDEVVLRAEVPLGDVPLDVRMFKVARRFDNDIAAVSAAFALSLDGDTITSARVAFGGMSATPSRALAVESALVGGAWDQAAVLRACAAIESDFQPLDDVRGSAEYRRRVAFGVIERWWLQTRPLNPLPVDETEVWTFA